MKRNKFRALITLDPARQASQGKSPLSENRPLLVLARHHETHRRKIFSGFAAHDDDCPVQPADGHEFVTMELLGDDLRDYLGAGDTFNLWLGSVAGHGIVSRKVIPCW